MKGIVARFLGVSRVSKKEAQSTGTKNHTNLYTTIVQRIFPQINNKGLRYAPWN